MRRDKRRKTSDSRRAAGGEREVRQVLVLSVPGVFTEYDELDRVRGAMNERFEGMFDQEGYTLLGWGDVGKGRLFSKRRIERPRDLRAARVWAPTTDVVFSEFHSRAMLCKGDWKLDLDMHGQGHLYNLAEDPVELTNLYGSAATRDIERELLADLLPAVASSGLASCSSTQTHGQHCG